MGGGSRVQLVARIETQLRLRDAWLAELHAVRSAELLGKVCRGRLIRLRGIGSRLGFGLPRRRQSRSTALARLPL